MWNPFKKKEPEEEAIDPLKDLSLSGLKKGYYLDYDLKTWEVTAHNRYDYDGDWTDEWELTSASEVRYLEREVDDEESWVLYRKMPVSEIEEDVAAVIREDDDPPNVVTYGGESFDADSMEAGLFYREGGTNPGGQGKEFVAWSYMDAAEKRVLVIEQWGENEFAAAIGDVVEPYMFSDILPGG